MRLKKQQCLLDIGQRIKAFAHKLNIIALNLINPVTMENGE
jgi:hypothetical protein